MPRVRARRDQPASDAPARAPASRTEGNAPASPAARARGALIVEDGTTASAEQMTKSDFLSALRSSVCSAADVELMNAGLDTQGCPYIENAFDRYAQRDAAYVERGLRRYAPEAGSAESAREYIPLVSERIAMGVRHWVSTGAMPELPEGMSIADLGGGGGGLLGGIGASLFSGLGGLGALFKAQDGAAPPAADAGEVLDGLGPGRALDSGVRSRMERAFGHDFGSVRVHAGPEDSTVAASHGARALAVGEHVAFAAGEYRPGTVEGDAIIAHELAHTVQQNSARSDAGSAVSAMEHDADAAAASAVGRIWGWAGLGNRRPRLSSGLRIDRCPTQTILAQMPRTTAPMPAYANRPEMELVLMPALRELWQSTFLVDHNTADNILRGRAPVYNVRELRRERDIVSGSERCFVPDPERNWVPNLDTRTIACTNPGGEVDRDSDGQNPIILLNPAVATVFDDPDLERGRIVDLKSILVHEMTHAVNADWHQFPAAQMDFGYFESEFAARWVQPQFRRIQPDSDRAAAIKRDILDPAHSGYHTIQHDYARNADYRRRVDEYERPAPGYNITATWPAPTSGSP